jgi:hypothetical protein
MELRTKDLKIALDDTYPVIREYEYKGSAKIGGGDPATGNLTVNGAAVPWSELTIESSKTKSEVSYSLPHNDGYAIDITYGLEPEVPVENLALIETEEKHD